MKLHLGCGHHLLDGWVNVDNDPGLPNQDGIKIMDVTGDFDFPDNTFDFVFSEHVIEHMTWSQGLNMLRESHRVLRSGGTLRVATPNINFLVELLREPDRNNDYLEWATKEFLPDAPYVSSCMVVNNFVRDWGHLFIYDGKTLHTSLKAAGFRRAYVQDLSVSQFEELRGLENVGRMPSDYLDRETMVMEAIK